MPIEIRHPVRVRHGLALGLLSRLDRVLALVGLLFASVACRPELDAGEWVCTETGVARPAVTGAVSVPWSTSFEDRFCDYEQQAGFCYEEGDASYDIVTSPVRTGRYSAAFRVNTEAEGEHHARCIRQGVLPISAYYGAWYFIPTTADTGGDVWNLLHFQGGAGPAARLRNQWDVSVINGTNDDLQLVVYTPRVPGPFVADEPRPIPIGEWFHIEMFLTRAADETGEVALYQDGSLLFRASDLITDATPFTQWYVGNYSDGITPALSTVYVDDVSIRTE